MSSTYLSSVSGRRAAAAVLASVAALLGDPDAKAQESIYLPEGVSGTIVLTTDYVDAGFSQTNGKVAAQGGLQWTHASGVYMGFWASNVDFGSSDPVFAEVAVSAGRSGNLNVLNSTVRYDLAATYSFYPRKYASSAAAIDRERSAELLTDFPPDASIPVNPDNVSGDYEFLELPGELTAESPLGTWAISAAYAPNIPGGTGHAIAAAIGLAMPIADTFNASGAVQKSWMPASAGADYLDWNAGLTYSARFADFDLRYYQAQDKACGGGCPARFVFSVIKEF